MTIVRARNGSTSTRDIPAATRAWLVLALVCAGQFMVVLDVAIVNVALPSIQTDLGVSQNDLQWAVTAYGIFLGGFLLLGGRAADRLGRRRVFVTGVLVFAGSSLVAGLSTTLGVLVAARGAQGFGAALTASAALSILTATFAEGPARTRALGVWGAISASGATVGVVMSGLLTDGPGWEWIFFINVPVGLALAGAASRLLPETHGERRHGFDVLGAVTITAGLLLLVFGVNRGGIWGWTDARTAGVLAASLALHAAFLVIESRVSEPLVPLGRVADRTVGLANVVAFLLLGSFFSLIFVGTLVMQQVLGFSALQAGLAWLTVSVPALVTAATTGAVLVERIGVRPILVTGLSILAVALFGLSQLDAGASFASGLLPWFVMAGIGIGLCFPTAQVAAFTGFDESDSGLASGLVNTSQEVGGAVGVAVLAAVAIAVSGDAAASGAGRVDALADGFARAFLVGGFVAIGGIVMATLLPRPATRRRGAPSAAMSLVRASGCRAGGGVR
jgi:EmrB/QacA subfamily drug resistance transporter